MLAVEGAAREEALSPEHKAPRKRRLERGLSVIEGSRKVSTLAPGEAVCTELENVEPEARRSYSRLAAASRSGEGKQVSATSDLVEGALNKRPPGFAEDYFLADGCTKLTPAVAALATAISERQLPPKRLKVATEACFSEWLQLLQMGFSLLLQGIGSKRKLIQDFADKSLKPWGAVCVHIDGFDSRFSLSECLRGILEQVYSTPARGGHEALAATLRSAVTNAASSHYTPGPQVANAVAAASPGAGRHLCLLVHNIEILPQAHQATLSSLCAAPRIHMVASCDNVWAPLAWGPRCLKDFNFCREEANTFLGYEAEAAARFPGALPPWSGLGPDRLRTPKKSLSLVLRSLTNNHRELVQVIAERQLANGGRSGISMSALLKVTTDRMIAASLPKLRSLLNELKDHEVVVQRGTLDGGVLFQLHCQQRTLERLAEGEVLESDDEGDVDVTHGDEDEEEDYL
mmetsp:Transcript_156480/g.276407  ORF Transcript_156480/g.276407 Transcript_156480/m.276407 type:complete len:460 (-) Transcript_156480:114-1493(-)